MAQGKRRKKEEKGGQGGSWGQLLDNQTNRLLVQVLVSAPVLNWVQSLCLSYSKALVLDWIQSLCFYWMCLCCHYHNYLQLCLYDGRGPSTGRHKIILMMMELMMGGSFFTLLSISPTDFAGFCLTFPANCFDFLNDFCVL